jgi:death-on-curing protein
MRLLSLDEVLALYYRIMRDTGGAAGVLNVDTVKSALTQPKLTFDGVELYPSLAEKASAIGHSLIANHPFLDGNKRIGQAVMEAVLIRNGYEVSASIDEQEQIILCVARGEMTRRELSEWLQAHMQLRTR